VILNSALQIIGEAGAMQIGNAAHSGSISKPTQLALHAGLGCGIGAGMSGGGSGCASGVAAGVIGELTGETLRDAGVDKNTGTQIAGIAGSLSTIVTGGLTGESDHNIAKGIYAGQYLGSNAAANNSYFIGGKVKIPFPGEDYDIHAGVQSNVLFKEDSIGTDGRGTNFLLVPEIGAGMYVYAVPHGQSPSISTSWGYRNTISADYIRTNQGGSGFGYTFGISTAPATAIPVNVSVSIPEKK